MTRYGTIYKVELFKSKIRSANMTECKLSVAGTILLIGLLSACSDKPDNSASRAMPATNQPMHTTVTNAPSTTQTASNKAPVLTVALLEERGAEKLSTEEILALIVDHSIVFQHLGTGEYFEAIYLKNGLRLLTGIDAGSLEGETLQDKYVITNDKLQTEFKGTSITTSVYQLDQRYLAAVDNDNGVVNYEIRDIQKAPFTAQVLKSQNARELSTEEIKQIFIGKTLLIKDLLSGDEYHGSYGEDGIRTLRYINPAITNGGPESQKMQDPYRIANGKLHSVIDGNEVASTIFELESRYYGALSIDDGAVNYEFISQ